jgi:hypothetical protein
MHRRHAAITAIAVLATACGGSGSGRESDGVASERSAVVSDNGRSLNGRSLNGRSLNGRSLNGRSLNGRSLNGVTLNATSGERVTIGGVELARVALSGTVFSGWVDGKSKGEPDFRGHGFVGSVWNGVLSDGAAVELRVDAIEPLPAPNGDLFGYAMSVATDEGWVSYCGEEADGTPALAIPMEGVWNYGENARDAGRYDDDAQKGFTFACRHAAIAKCVELGYRPWEKRHGKSLQPLTVACTRLLRADYCGTGVSYTLDGTLLDLSDDLGVQPVAEPGWAIEAAWDENGAVCMSPGSGDRFVNTGLMPPCYAKLAETKDCGARFEKSVRLVNRYAAQGQERFSGAWSGKATNGWGRVWMTLRQTGDYVAGSYLTDKGAFGTVEGGVIGRTLEVTMSSFGKKDCTGTLLGSALLDADGAVIAFDAAGRDCSSPLTFELTKQ